MMTSKDTVGETFDGLVSRLEKISDTAELDAQVLLARLLGQPRSWLLAHPEAHLDPEPAARLEEQVQRLEQGEPLPYVLGEWEFFGLNFIVSSAVLIPRPETELLVERAIAWFKSRSETSDWRAVDVGTGSGCIAVALAVNLPKLRVTSIDLSPAALEVARCNAEKNHVSDRITFLKADLLPDSSLPSSFSLIAANLPYIPTQTMLTLPIYGREPTIALDGGADGLALIRRLMRQVPQHLASDGLVLLEIEASLGAAALALARQNFPAAGIRLHQDLAGNDRLLEIQF